MRFISNTYRAMLKDRDYDVTSYDIAHIDSKWAGGRWMFARCTVDMVGEECDVYCEDGRWGLGETSIVVVNDTMVTSGGEI